MQFRTVFSVIILLISSFLVTSQMRANQAIDYDQLLHGLESQIIAGQKRGLRDLATFLDDPNIADQVQNILFENTLFLPSEIDLSKKTNRQSFLDFYYTNESKIQYSDIFDAFFITPIEKWAIERLQIKNVADEEKDESNLLRNLVQVLERELPKGDVKTCQGLVTQIANLRLPEGYQALLNIFETTPSSNKLVKAKREIDKHICQALVNHPEQEVMAGILSKASEGGISKTIANEALNKITNVDFTTGNDYEAFYERMTYLLDSLESLEQIKIYGYQGYFPFNPSFFPEEVDYYGRILTSYRPESWIVHNAIKDVINTRHPRALFYLSAYFYKNRDRGNKKSQVVNEAKIDSLNTIISNVIISGSSLPANYNFQSASNQKALNHLIYWSQKYEEYEWNDDQNCFVNKKLLAQKTEKFERMFRRLASKNDTIAVQSFIQLTEGKPREIFALSDKYRQLLRNYNHAIPSLKYQYLEMLTLLTDYSKRNKHRYRLPTRLQKTLTKLKENITPQERYQIENELIKSIQLDDITAIEYWATINERNESVSFSVGRILDWTYSRFWETIMSDEAQLRLFLKKSELFSNYGVYGICNVYLNKFDGNIKNQILKNHFEEILRTESDGDIRNQLNQLLSKFNEGEEEVASFDIDYFLSSPQDYNRDELSMLPSITKQDELQKCIEAIKANQDKEDIKAIFSYLSTHPNMEMVPFLFQLSNDERVIVSSDEFELKVKDRIIPIIEEIYQHEIPSEDESQAFATTKWIEIWQKDGSNFKSWKKNFYAQKVKMVLAKAKLKIDEINEITESEDFSEALLPDVLASLERLKSKRNIRKLNLPEKLSVDKYLPYFSKLRIGYKDLDDIPKYFKVEAVDQMLKFFDEKCADYEPDQQGSFYNNILQKSWMEQAIKRNLIPTAFAKRIYSSLDNYLNESDFISEFEERRTILHMAQLESIGKTLEEKLLASFNMDADDNSKAQYQANLISQISFSEIGTVLKYVDQLAATNNRNSYDFLSKNFGIPIFDISDYKTQKEFTKNYHKMAEVELYQHYLKIFGLDIWKKKSEKLDYEKIYKVLQFDIVSPFAGSGGSKRDWYIYGIIKVLEHHFNDRLGYNETLSEARNQYDYSTARRAEAWFQYLINKKLVNPDQNFSPSFNMANID